MSRVTFHAAFHYHQGYCRGNTASVNPPCSWQALPKTQAATHGMGIFTSRHETPCETVSSVQNPG